LETSTLPEIEGGWIEKKIISPFLASFTELIDEPSFIVPIKRKGSTRSYNFVILARLIFIALPYSFRKRKK